MHSLERPHGNLDVGGPLEDHEIHYRQVVPSTSMSVPGSVQVSTRDYKGVTVVFGDGELNDSI